MPRKALDREDLKARIEQLFAAHQGQDGSHDWVGEFIRTTVASGRRHWPKLPSGLTVLAQVSYDGSTALLCDEAATRKLVYWLKGLCVRDKLVLFDSELSMVRASDISAQVANACWTARIPVSNFDDLALSNLPKMAVSYEPRRLLKKSP